MPERAGGVKKFPFSGWEKVSEVCSGEILYPEEHVFVMAKSYYDDSSLSSVESEKNLSQIFTMRNWWSLSGKESVVFLRLQPQDLLSKVTSHSDSSNLSKLPFKCS